MHFLGAIKQVASLGALIQNAKVAENPNRLGRHRSKICPNPNVLAYSRSSWTGANIHMLGYEYNIPFVKKFLCFWNHPTAAKKLENNRFRVPTHFAPNRFTFEKFPPPPPLLHPRNCYTSKIHQIQKLRFLGISRYKFKFRFWYNLNLYRGIWGSGFGRLLGCSICSGYCQTWTSTYISIFVYISIPVNTCAWIFCVHIYTSYAYAYIFKYIHEPPYLTCIHELTTHFYTTIGRILPHYTKCLHELATHFYTTIRTILPQYTICLQQDLCLQPPWALHIVLPHIHAMLCHPTHNIYSAALNISSQIFACSLHEHCT